MESNKLPTNNMDIAMSLEFDATDIPQLFLNTKKINEIWQLILSPSITIDKLRAIRILTPEQKKFVAARIALKEFAQITEQSEEYSQQIKLLKEELEPASPAPSSKPPKVNPKLTQAQTKLGM